MPENFRDIAFDRLKDEKDYFFLKQLDNEFGSYIIVLLKSRYLNREDIEDEVR